MIAHMINARYCQRNVCLLKCPIRYNAGFREENIRIDGRKESDVQVLDAFGLGDQYYQSSAKRGHHQVRSHCADAVGRAE